MSSIKNNEAAAAAAKLDNDEEEEEGSHLMMDSLKGVTSFEQQLNNSNNNSMTSGQNKRSWSHYSSKRKKEKTSLIATNIRQMVMTITEEEESDDDYSDAGFLPTMSNQERQNSFSLVPGGNQSSSDSLLVGNDNDILTPPATTDGSPQLCTPRGVSPKQRDSSAIDTTVIANQSGRVSRRRSKKKQEQKITPEQEPTTQPTAVPKTIAAPVDAKKNINEESYTNKQQRNAITSRRSSRKQNTDKILLDSTPAMTPGAVAIDHTKTATDTAGKGGSSYRFKDRAKSRRMMRKKSKDAASFNKNGRKKSTADRRKRRGSLHTLTIGSNGGSKNAELGSPNDGYNVIGLEEERSGGDHAGALGNVTAPTALNDNSNEDALGKFFLIEQQQQQQQHQSNVVMDDSMSVITEVTAHSMTTIQVRNDRTLLRNNLVQDSSSRNESIVPTTSDSLHSSSSSRPATRFHSTQPQTELATTLQQNNGGMNAMVVMIARKHSPFALFSCGVALMAIIACSVVVGIVFARASDQSTVPPPFMLPSSSPTSLEWNAVTEIRKDDVESFGYHVKLSSNGETLAVTSPLFDGSKGRLDVFAIEQGVEDQPQSWRQLGIPIIGDIIGDELGASMDLSEDGSTVAVGSPSSDAGKVQLFHIGENGLSPKGQIIYGPAPDSEFGYSVALNLDGTRVFIGAPQFGVDIDAIYGMVQVYDFDGTEWVQLGADIIGKARASRFGVSVAVGVDGNRVVVGAPMDSEVWDHAGRVFWFNLSDDSQWTEFVSNQMKGSQAGSALGSQLAMNYAGVIVASNGRDNIVEEFPNAGVVEVWGLTPEYSDVWQVGYPVGGTYEEAHFGYDVDLDHSGELMLASNENQEEYAGSVQAFVLRSQGFEEFGNVLKGPKVGDKTWKGKGPSVAVAAWRLRVAIGYESIISNGVSCSAVRIYDFFVAPHNENTE